MTFGTRDMNELGKQESAVEGRSPDDLARFWEWFVEFDARLWDAQSERDAAAGRLESGGRAVRRLPGGRDARPLRNLAARRF
jgi:hypothetical protein